MISLTLACCGSFVFVENLDCLIVDYFQSEGKLILHLFSKVLKVYDKITERKIYLKQD